MAVEDSKKKINFMNGNLSHSIQAIIRDCVVLSADIFGQEELQTFLETNINLDGNNEISFTEWIRADLDSDEANRLFGTGQEELRQNVFTLISRRFGLSRDRSQFVYPWDHKVQVGFVGEITMPIENSVHKIGSPILSRSSSDFGRYAHSARKYSAYGRFSNAVYFDNLELGMGDNSPRENANLKMIPLDQKEVAEQISYQILMEYCDRFDLDATQAVRWQNGMFTGGCISRDDDNGYEVFVDPEGAVVKADEEEYYVPACLTALHELMHIEQKLPPDETGFPEIEYQFSYAELGPTLVSVILQDEVYKRINDITLTDEVQYTENIPTDFGESINLGLVANVFRDLLEKYGNIYGALMSTEGRAFVRKYYHA